MTEPRILSDDETYKRRSEQASSLGPKTINLWQWKGCDRAAFNSPFCATHRHPTPTGAIVLDLTDEQITALKHQVEADAAPLFLVAVNWLARQQMARLGIDTQTLADGIERIRGELGNPS